MKTTFKLLAAAALMAAGLVQAATHNLIINGGFDESPSIGSNSILQLTNQLGPSFNADFGWITAAQGVEIRNARNFPAGNTHVGQGSTAQYAELAVEKNSSIWQSILLEDGLKYYFSFWLAPRSPYGLEENVLDVSVTSKSGASLFNQRYDGTTLGADGLPLYTGTGTIDIWRQYVVPVIGKGEFAEFKFAAAGSNGAYGMFVDSVSLVATPLPGAALLFGTSIAGFLAARKRRKAAALS